MRIVVSFVVAFLVTFLLGKVLIPFLRKMKAGQSIKEIGPTWHMSKQGTPTMGGLMFILGTAAAVLIAGWQDMAEGDFGAVFVYLFALVFGAIGYIDDYMKVKKHENTGLTAGWKFLLQLAAALVFTLLLRQAGYLKFDLYIPFLNITIVGIPPWLYMVFAAFVMVGTVNAVNLTDGIDGLATGVTMPVMLFFLAVSAIWDHLELSVFSSALFGGLCAFFLYNFHPAKVFMGDTGSLFLGGAVCGMAFALDMPLILVLVGIIYIAETLSDIIQVTYFKLTHGKRIFRMAPLHHHLEMGGWSEVKLVLVFAGITLGACLLAFFGVVDRYPVMW
ncbi:MAG TPA: phospho-N-acetylmuramoyl-pentapeptide-transferase [Candidatus Galloscillospira excrementavium]|nr:phospho-N-acetylmuramoyl-pentapeptide-transferase [Candidatus Galloscillospira excrementavium]